MSMGSVFEPKLLREINKKNRKYCEVMHIFECRKRHNMVHVLTYERYTAQAILEAQKRQRIRGIQDTY